MKTKSTLITGCWMLVVITSYAQTKTIPWLLRGNSNTDPSVNFIGTRDRQQLVFKVNNQKSGLIDYQTSKANTSFGYQTLIPILMGASNSAFGYKALSNNINGYSNTATGAYALQYNAYGSYNTATGVAALQFNTGSYNTAFGFQALLSNNDGEENVAIGTFSMQQNTNGGGNTAIGSSALSANNIGYDNTAIGSSALLGGHGNQNVALGAGAMQFNSTGNDNVAIGSRALVINSGNSNIAIGREVLRNSIAANNLIAIGDSTFYNSNGSVGNTAVGSKAGYSIESGSRNTYIGFQSGYADKGSDITAVGYKSVGSAVNGKGCTYIGSKARPNADNFTNAMSLGYNAITSASNQVRVGNSVVTSIGGQVGWTSFSDGRFKKNSRENVPGLAFINQLKPVTYTLDIAGIKKFREEGKEITADSKDIVTNKSPEYIVHTGFMAQDVEAAAKKIQYDFDGIDKPQNDRDLYGLRYAEFVVPLVKAVQELSQQNDGLRKENEALKTRLDKIEAVVLKSQGSNVELGMASKLEQNTPNPFSNTTTIGYYLPANASNAYINFYASNGSLLKTAKLSGAGKGTLTVKANELPSGVYQYALVVDGKVVDRKQMVQAK